MATINLGRIKPVFRGAYAGGTAYVVDDIVTHGNESFICIQAGTGNATSNASYWTKLAAKGTDGTDVGTTLTTQGDILYRDGSGLQRLAAGTNGQALITGGAGANPSWGTISSGTYSVHAIDTYRATSQIGQTTSTDYKDIADGNTVQFTPTSTNDFIQFSYTCGITPYTGMGMNTYLMMSTNSTIGSGDTKLDYDGKDIGMFTGSSAGQVKATKSKTFIMPCTNLTVGTTYYVEQAGSSNFNGNWGYWNSTASNATGDFNNHYVSMVHYKRNS